MKVSHGKGWYVLSQSQGSDRVIVHAESRTDAAHALGDTIAWVLSGPHRTKREALGRGPAKRK